MILLMIMRQNLIGSIQLNDIGKKIRQADPNIADNKVPTNKYFPKVKIEKAGETTVEATKFERNTSMTRLVVMYNGVRSEELSPTTTPAEYTYYGPGTYTFFVESWVGNGYRVVSEVITIQRTEPLKEVDEYEAH